MVVVRRVELVLVGEPVVLLETDPVGRHGGERLPEAVLRERVFLAGEVGGYDRVGSEGDAGDEDRQGKAAQKSSRTALTQCALDEVHGNTPVFSAFGRGRRSDGDPAAEVQSNSLAKACVPETTRNFTLQSALSPTRCARGYVVSR